MDPEGTVFISQDHLSGIYVNIYLIYIFLIDVHIGGNSYISVDIRRYSGVKILDHSRHWKFCSITHETNISSNTSLPLVL